MFNFRWWCGLTILLMAGCRQSIQHGLEESEANGLVSVLVQRGIHAEKVSEGGRKPSWILEVPREQSSDAIRILTELGLPKPKLQGFADVFGRGSLVPTPTEERALFLHALTGELAQTLETLDGVLSARVHVVVPAPAAFGVAVSGQVKAAAFVKVAPGARPELEKRVEELRRLIASSIEGLNPEHVTVMLNETSSHVAASKSRSPGARWLPASLGLTVFALAVCVAVLSFTLRRARASLRILKEAS
jgi:type III secretion protein J